MKTEDIKQKIEDDGNFFIKLRKSNYSYELHCNYCHDNFFYKDSPTLDSDLIFKKIQHHLNSPEHKEKEFFIEEDKIDSHNLNEVLKMDISHNEKMKALKVLMKGIKANKKLRYK